MDDWQEVEDPDWRELILELIRAGYSDEGIAKAVLVPKSTYQSWKYGTVRPNYVNGTRLQRFHAHVKQTKIQTT